MVDVGKIILTLQDLCERWQCGNEEIYDAMFNAVNPLKFLNLARTPVKRHGKGPKKIRFRLEAVCEWELTNQEQFKTDAKVKKERASQVVTVSPVADYSHLRRGKAGPRNSKSQSF